MFRLWLRVAREQQFTVIGGWHMDIDHLNGLELVEYLTWGKAFGQRLQLHVRIVRNAADRIENSHY